jgi:autotransporter-associated beta strand protein
MLYRQAKNLLLHQVMLKGWLLLLLVGFFQPAARAAALLYEPFPSSYGNGTLLRAGNSVTVWSGGNGTGPGSAVITNIAAMNYPTLVTATTPDTSYGIMFSNTPSNDRDAVAPFSSTGVVLGSNNPSLYCSFLLEVLTPPSSGFNILANYRSDGSSGSPIGLGLWLDSSSNLYVERGGTTTPTAPPVALSAGVNLVVVCYRWIDGVHDRAEMWVNPTTNQLGVGEASVPAPNATSTQGTAVPAGGFEGFQLTRAHSSNGGAAASSGIEYIDEIRIGTNWADVTPSVACVPVGLTSSPTNQTVFAGGTATFTCGVTGSSPTYSWQLSMDGGNSWGAVYGGSGAATANYTTPALVLTNSGTLYRCIASVACDYSSVTSAVAGVTVLDPATFYFLSAGSGNWTNLSTWQQSTDNATWTPAVFTPSYENAGITIQTGHVVTVSSPVTADNLVVQPGGTLLIGGGTLTLYASSAVDGDFYGSLVIATNAGGALVFSNSPALKFENGGQFTWGLGATPVIPAATWAQGATCSVTNCSTASTPKPGGLGQNFGNFTWDWAAQANTVDFAGTLTNVQGNLYINTGRTVALADGSPAASTLKIGGNFTISGPMAGSSKVNFVSGTSTALEVVNIGGNFTVNSLGTGLDCTDTNSLADINFTGSGAQSLNITSTNISGTTRSQWSVAAGSTLTLDSGLPMTNGVISTASMNVNGTLDLNGNSLSPPVLTGAGQIINSTGTATLAVGGAAPSSNCVFGGTINDGGQTISLTKNGNNTFTLTGGSPNSYTGTNTVNGGTLDVQEDGGLGSGPVIVASGATLKLEQGSANDYISSGANLLLNTNSVVNLAFSGTDTINALSFDGGVTFQPAGTWGAAGSGAQFSDTRFAGAGLLNVLTGGAVSGTCSSTNSIVSIVKNPNNTCTITFLGTPQAQYFVQTETNLLTAGWAAVASSTNTAGGSGLWQFTATNSAALRFFRAVAVNPCP